MRFDIKGMDAMKDLAKAVREAVEAHPTIGAATILALEGDLGSGKTAFSQFLAGTFNIPQQVTSPTFVVVRRYPIPSDEYSNFKNLIHVDAYRIESPEEARTLGLEQSIAGEDNLIIIEWPKKLGNIVPDAAHCIRFSVVDETTRAVEVVFPVNYPRS